MPTSSSNISACAGSNSNQVIRDSVASGNTNAGFYAQFTSSQVDVENSLTTHNAVGLDASGKVRASETTIEENATGLLTHLSGTITSFGNNRLAGNTTNGSFTTTIPLQ